MRILHTKLSEPIQGPTRLDCFELYANQIITPALYLGAAWLPRRVAPQECTCLTLGWSLLFLSTKPVAKFHSLHIGVNLTFALHCSIDPMCFFHTRY